MKKYKYQIVIFLILIGIFLFTPLASAQEEMGMVTGSQQGTYFRFGQEIADKAKKVGLEIVVRESEGSLDNIKLMISKENAAFAIVQSDVLSFLKRSNEPELKQVSKKLRLIFPFYNEEVHLFARKEIKQFSDLQGKRLVLGKQGSGNWLTSVNLLKITGVKPGESLYLSPADAVVAVLNEKADAMIYVAGKPVALFTKLNDLKSDQQLAPLLDKVHFVPLDDPRILQEYIPSTISSNDYSWFSGQIPTVAVKSALVSFDFSGKNNNYFKMRCEQLSRLGQVVRDNIDVLKRDGHPKWKEVDLEGQINIWQLDSCSRSGKSTPMSDSIDKKLKCTLTGKCS